MHEPGPSAGLRLQVGPPRLAQAVRQRQELLLEADPPLREDALAC